MAEAVLHAPLFELTTTDGEIPGPGWPRDVLQSLHNDDVGAHGGPDAGQSQLSAHAAADGHGVPGAISFSSSSLVTTPGRSSPANGRTGRGREPAATRIWGAS